jgi:mRNA interferase MazF
VIRRGDIVLVDFDPGRSTEANKIRPAIVVTNDRANEHGSNVVAVPLTSNTERTYPFQLFLPAEQTGLQHDSKAQVELLRSVGRGRLGRRLGSLPKSLLEQLDQRLRLHLDLA